MASSVDLGNLQGTVERLEALDAMLARGLKDEAAGRTKSADEAFDRLSAKYEALARRRNESWSY
jgi:predicted transcriptional regulator